MYMQGAALHIHPPVLANPDIYCTRHGLQGRVKPFSPMRRHILFILYFIVYGAVASAQINTNRVLLMGRNALYYEDYVLAIQRFNAVIAAKPYLVEPYFYRGLAKFYLEDYSGAEADCSLALDRRPYTAQYYTLRALCRINQERYAPAVDDYMASIQQTPMERNNWHNMVLCMMEIGRYDSADVALDSMMVLWPRESAQCTMKAQVALARKDTLGAEVWVDSALVLDNYDGGAWSMKAGMLLRREDYAGAETALDRAIVQKPRVPGLYVTRALTRFHRQNIRGAMSDYDQAIEIDKDSYVAHYNRGLLRAQVGDDNRAIEDFDYVLSVEPDNMIALYNRAILLDQTGDYRGAIRDISTVIEAYPQFWTGYRQRAAILRKIGDTYGAERDEFRVLKAEMEVRTGTYRVQNTTRRKSDTNIEDYNKLVVEDEDSPMDSYASEFRGRVQNRQTELKCLPMYILGFYRAEHPTRRYLPYSKEVEDFTLTYRLEQPLLVCSEEVTLDSARLAMHQERILRDDILGQRCQSVLDNYIVRDFETSMSMLDSMIVSVPQADPILHFLRAQVRTSQIEAQPINDSELRLGYLEVLQDWKLCARSMPAFPYASYNVGNTYVKLKDYSSAIAAYTEAITRDPDMPEAYYNRGIAYILADDTQRGLADLSKAGEMGLYQAYSLIKKYSKQT